MIAPLLASTACWAAQQSLDLEPTQLNQPQARPLTQQTPLSGAVSGPQLVQPVPQQYYLQQTQYNPACQRYIAQYQPARVVSSQLLSQYHQNLEAAQQQAYYLAQNPYAQSQQTPAFSQPRVAAPTQPKTSLEMLVGKLEALNAVANGKPLTITLQIQPSLLMTLLSIIKPKTSSATASAGQKEDQFGGFWDDLGGLIVDTVNNPTTLAPAILTVDTNTILRYELEKQRNAALQAPIDDFNRRLDAIDQMPDQIARIAAIFDLPAAPAPDSSHTSTAAKERLGTLMANDNLRAIIQGAKVRDLLKILQLSETGYSAWYQAQMSSMATIPGLVSGGNYL